MKKVLFITLLLVCGVVNAQNYIHINIEDIQSWETLNYCTTQYDGVVIEKESGCEEWWHWYVVIDGQGYHYETDNITLTPYENLEKVYWITYSSMCGIGEREFYVNFSEFQAPEPWSQPYVWKRIGTSVNLEAYGGYNYQWSTGSTNSSITVTEPGTYWVRIYNDCGELYDTIQVRDNVEIELATCDLESNLNIVTWPTTPAQAEYVDHVIIKRDGVQVGTANYTNGYYLDDIGSDAASRTYTITAVATDGAQCPIVSYPKETIHMSYLLGMGNTIDVTWNVPTGYDLMGYNICEWNPNGKDGELTIIDYVGAGVTSYTCFESQFNNGNIVVQGVEEGKTESRLLSNRSWETVSINEHQGKTFKLYPNPSNGTFTVEGTTTLFVYNVMGQTIATSHAEDGVHTFSLTPGIYFVKSDEGAVQKVVVE